MNYRIMLATSGSYYVQKLTTYGAWKKTGGFFRTKVGARAFVRDLQGCYCKPQYDKVVEYC